MTRFAVSYINWFDNELTTEFVIAKDWREALTLHSKSFFKPENDYKVPETEELAKRACFDCDGMMEVVVVPTD